MTSFVKPPFYVLEFPTDLPQGGKRSRFGFRIDWTIRSRSRRKYEKPQHIIEPIILQTDPAELETALNYT